MDNKNRIYRFASYLQIFIMIFLSVGSPHLSSAAWKLPGEDTCVKDLPRDWDTICKKCSGVYARSDKDPTNQLDSYCAAKYIKKNAEAINITAMSLYLAGTAVCGVACGLEMTGAGKLASTALCTGAGGVAFAFDISSTIYLSVEGAEFSTWMQQSAMGLGATAAAGGGIYKSGQRTGAVMGEKSALAAREAAEKAAKEAAKDAAMEATEKAGKEAAAKAAQKAHREATKKLAKTEGSSCWAAGFFAIAATLKGVNMKMLDDNDKKNEQKIYNIYSEYFKVDPNSVPPPGNNNANTNPLSLGGNTGGGEGKGQTPSNETTSEVPDVALTDSAGNFPNLSSSAALAHDPFLKAFNEMPRKNEIPEALAQAGVNTKDLMKQLESKPLGEALAAVAGGLPEEVKSTLNEIDKLGKEGKITYKAENGPTYSGGGGGAKPAAPANDFSAFKRPDAGPVNTTPQQMEFKPEKPAALTLGGTDIFHAEWNGTIFQLVSTKINLSKDRIEELEWATPLNRALSGLPKHPQPNSQSDKPHGK